MARGGNDLDLVVGVRSLVGQGLKVIENQLKSLPSGISIDIKATMGDVTAIKKSKENIYDLAKIAQRVSSDLDSSLGQKGVFKRMVDSAVAYEKNIEGVRKSLINLQRQAAAHPFEIKHPKGYKDYDFTGFITKNVGANIGQTLDRIREIGPKLAQAYRLYANSEKAQNGTLGKNKKAFEQLREEAKNAFRDSRNAAKTFTQELNGVQVAMRSTSQFASQLREDIQQAFGWYALKNFLGHLVEIGGQFEYQRRAIANILQDGTKANTLFNQIKELGVKSPFSTLDLDKYAKQLSAFEIPYNEMFDKLKKIADIAAGTGADMSRIILAYGHVKAEGFLTGVQRRQFSNANINMVGGLSKYYSEQEGRLVNTREVYKRIHDKQVSFEDMDTVLMRMAEEGGQFFRMQETMAETVKGVYKNLGDSINHAYMAMEQSSNGPLMAFGQGLTSILKLVERFPGAASRFITIATAMAAIRALNARMLDQETAATLRRIVALDNEKLKLQQINNVSQVSKRLSSDKWGKWQRSSLGQFIHGAALSQETADNIANKIRQGGADGESMKRIVMQAGKQRQLNKATLEYLVTKKAITAEELNWIKKQRSAIGLAIRGIKSLLKAYGPLLLLTIAIEGVTWAWNKFNDTEGEERRKKQIDALADSYESLRRAMEGLPKSEDFSKMFDDELFSSIKEMVVAIKDNLGGAELILGRILAQDANGEYLNTTVGQAEAMRKELEEAERIKKRLKDTKTIDIFTPNENIKNDWESLEKRKKSHKESSLDFMKSNVYEDILTYIPDEYKTLNGHSSDKLEYFNSLIGNTELLKKIFKGKDASFKSIYYKLDGWGPWDNSLSTLTQGLYNIQTDSNSLDKSIIQWAGSAIESAKTLGYNTAAERYKVLMEGINAQEATQDYKNYVADLVTKTYYPALYEGRNSGDIKAIDPYVKEVNEQIKDLFSTLRLSHTEGTISNIEKIVEAYKKAKEGLKTMSMVDELAQFKVNPKSPQKISGPYQLDVLGNKAVNDWNKNQENYQSIVTAAGVYGLTIEDLEKLINKNKGKGEDKEFKKLQTWFDTINRASNEYKDYSKTFGSAKAFEMVSSMPEFKDVLSGMDENTLSNLSKAIRDKISEKSDDWYGKSEERKKFRNKMAQRSSELNLSSEIDNQTRWVREVDKYMSDKLQRYDIYTKMYNATGSHSTAQQFAFGTEGLRQNYGDFVKATFNSKFAERGLDYDTLAGWTEEQWKTEEGEEIRKTFEDAEKSIKQWKKSMNEAYIDLIKDSKSYEQTLKNIDAAYEKEVDIINANQDLSLSEKESLASAAQSRMNLSMLDAELENTNFNKNFTSYTEEAFNGVIDKMKKAIEDAFANGVIDSSTYRSRTEEIQKMQLDYSSANALPYVSSTTQAFLSGGLTGYFNKVKQDYDELQVRKKQEGYVESEADKKIEKRAKKIFGKDGTDDGKGGFKGATDAVKEFTDSLLKGAGDIKAVAGLLEDTFSALGMDEAAGVAGDVGSIAGGIMGGASALQGLGPWGMAAGAALGAIGSIAKAHDNKLNKKIEQSQQRVKKLKNEYEQLDRQIDRSFVYNSEDTSSQYENLKKQKDELEYQIQMEKDKKKTDWGWVEDAEAQVQEMTETIKYYFADMWKELYGMDLQDYGKRLGDAIIEAFQNGEDAAVAWKRTVGDIVRELAGELIKQKFIMPKLEQAFNDIFGVDGNGGILGGNTELTQEKIEQVGNVLGNMVTESDLQKAELMYSWFEEKFPYSNVDESVGGLSKIGTALTEETGSVISAYINTIRADVSYNRKNLSAIVERGLPAIENINVIAQSQLTQLNAIADNTKTNADAAKSILAVLQSATNGTKPFYIN